MEVATAIVCASWVLVSGHQNNHDDDNDDGDNGNGNAHYDDDDVDNDDHTKVEKLPSLRNVSSRRHSGQNRDLHQLKK